MYFVNRAKIEEILNYMEKIQSEYKQHSFNDFAERLLLERLTHMSVEAIIDVGNMMIDGFIMRDPGSYEDIIDILTDEKVLPVDEQEGYKRFIQLRKVVVQHYTNIPHTDVEKVWNDQWTSIENFSVRVRKYLDNELGPVSAFSKN